MNKYPCSGCGLRNCDGRCYLEYPADCPDDNFDNEGWMNWIEEQVDLHRYQKEIEK